MAFSAKFMNQGAALVHVQQDGSVSVNHGGTEMGQGLHTKMAQVAATALGCPLSDVHVYETGTDKVANTSPTAASQGSDINGMAVLDACKQISARLAPVRDRLDAGKSDPKDRATLAAVANAAYFDRINLR